MPFINHSDRKQFKWCTLRLFILCYHEMDAKSKMKKPQVLSNPCAPTNLTHLLEWPPVGDPELVALGWRDPTNYPVTSGFLVTLVRRAKLPAPIQKICFHNNQLWSFRRFTYGNLVTTFTSSKCTSSSLFVSFAASPKACGSPVQKSHWYTQSVVATGGVYKGQGQSRSELCDSPLLGIPRLWGIIAIPSPKHAKIAISWDNRTRYFTGLPTLFRVGHGKCKNPLIPAL